MLPAANRLRTAADFQDTIRRGAKASRGAVVVYVLASPGDQAPRVGTVVSRRVGGSVIRHRAARRIRGAMAPLLDTLPGGCRVVVRALPGADTDPFLAESLRSALKSGRERSTRTEATS